MTKIRFVLLLVAGSATLPGAAYACAEPPDRQTARQLLTGAAAVIDGIVVRATGANGEPALVRPVRIYKGPQLRLFAVGTSGSCDVTLTSVGERVRLVLRGGPRVYHMPVGPNYFGINRLLRSPVGYRIGNAEEPPGH
jgi:hypothetical protein